MARRGRGEGYIRKREDRGGWEGSLRLGDGKRKSVYGATRQEVQRKLTALRRDLEAGLPVVSERQTVGQFLQGWVESRKGEVRLDTWRRYECLCRVHLIPELGQVPLTRLTAQHVQAMEAQAGGALAAHCAAPAPLPAHRP
jgi:hypothetical protein